MKRRRRSLTDLNNDVLKHILIHVAKSSNGLLNLARTLSVCRVFRELAQDKMVLKAVAYDSLSIPLCQPSFWQVDGLLVQCMCAGNVTVLEIERKYVKLLHTICKVLKRESAPRILDVLEKNRALETVNTRSRRKALESATKKYEELSGHIDDLDQKLVQLVKVHEYVDSHQHS